LASRLHAGRRFKRPVRSPLLPCRLRSEAAGDRWTLKI